MKVDRRLSKAAICASSVRKYPRGYPKGADGPLWRGGWGGEEPPDVWLAAQGSEQFARNDVALDFARAFPDPLDAGVAPDAFQGQFVHQPHAAMDLNRLIRSEEHT